MSPQQQLLRDEAAAWREIAALYANNDLFAVACWWGRGSDRPGMRNRADSFTGSGKYNANADAAIACLFLALEAEDELKALTPKKRSAGPSSLRRPRQHTRGK